MNQLIDLTNEDFECIAKLVDNRLFDNKTIKVTKSLVDVFVTAFSGRHNCIKIEVLLKFDYQENTIQVLISEHDRKFEPVEKPVLLKVETYLKFNNYSLKSSTELA